jgi:hypothetical protein
MHQLCHLTIIPYSQQSLPRRYSVEVFLEGTKFNLADPSGGEVRLSFRHIRADHPVVSALLRWLHMAFGGAICIRRDEVEVQFASTNTAIVRFCPGWPCDSCFEVCGICDSVATEVLRWSK